MRLTRQAQASTRPWLQFFITLGILSLTSCGTLQVPVEIKDEPLEYIKQASDSAWVVQMHFLTSGQDQVSRTQWEQMQQDCLKDPKCNGYVAMPLKSFADFNDEIGKLCSQVPCDYKTKKKFDELINRLESASGKAIR